MKRLTQSRRIPWLVIALAISLACNTLSNSASDEWKSDDVNVELDVTYGSGSYVLENPKVGLADLNSYTATLTLSFDGTRDGSPEKWSKKYVMIASKDPAVRQWSIENTDGDTTLDPTYLAELDGTDYEKVGKDACSAAFIQEGQALADQLEPARFLNILVGADEAGTDTVNDTAVAHYTFDQRALGQQDLTESNGEIWVASDGGYIVKYMLTSKATADYFGEGIEGTISYDYELTDVNKPAQFALPNDCPAGLVDVPRMSDAADVLSLPGLLTYSTASSPEDVKAFYESQMSALDWPTQADSALSGASILMNYARDTKSLSITITPGEKSTLVLVQLSNSTIGSAQ